MKYDDNMTIEDLLKKSSKKSILKRIGQLFKKKPLTYERALKNPLKYSTLDLKGLGLKELPESIGEFKNLVLLYLDNNQLTGLPDAIGNLTRLDTLSLPNNQLASLPDTIGNLTALRYIDLGNNQLASLPERICVLKKVQSFNAANNQLTRLPELFGEMSQIQVLNLNNNQIANLPESMGNLKENVLYFNISNNRLKTLPRTLHKVVFEDIYLNNNELETLGTLGEGGYRIDQLHLNGNNLTHIPDTLLKRAGLYLCVENNHFTEALKIELHKRKSDIRL